MRSGISLREDFDGEVCGGWRGRRRTQRRYDVCWHSPRSTMEARVPMPPVSADVTLQIVRDWVMRFNERGPHGLINGKAPGPQSRLNDQQRAALAQAIERGPTPYLDGVVRWRLCDLAQWLWEEFRVSVSEQTLSREVRAMGYRKLAARPKHHAQDPQAIEDFKKVSPPQWQRLPPEQPEENA
jgi:transposase